MVEPESMNLDRKKKKKTADGGRTLVPSCPSPFPAS